MFLLFLAYDFFWAMPNSTPCHNKVCEKSLEECYADSLGLSVMTDQAGRSRHARPAAHCRALITVRETLQLRTVFSADISGRAPGRAAPGCSDSESRASTS